MHLQVQLTVPFTRTAFSTTATFEVRSPKRLQLMLEKGVLQVFLGGGWGLGVLLARGGREGAREVRGRGNWPAKSIVSSLLSNE